MSPDEDGEEVAFDDEVPIEALAPFHDARPARRAWRADPERAPVGRPVYVRTPDSIRVVIALRDQAGWVVIRRDGELRTLEHVAVWAPLAAAIA